MGGKSIAVPGYPPCLIPPSSMESIWIKEVGIRHRFVYSHRICSLRYTTLDKPDHSGTYSEFFVRILCVAAYHNLLWFHNRHYVPLTEYSTLFKSLYLYSHCAVPSRP